MDKEYERWEEEDDREPTDKFDECFECIHRYNYQICNNECDFGESFEEESPEDLGDMIV